MSGPVFTNPFTLAGALALFLLRIGGYTLTFGIQVLCFLIQRRRHMIADAFGWYGRSVTDAVTKLVRNR